MSEHSPNAQQVFCRREAVVVSQIHESKGEVDEYYLDPQCLAWQAQNLAGVPVCLSDAS